MHKILAAAAVLATSGLAQAAAFTNGSFETGPNTRDFAQLDAGSTAIAGWTVGGNSIDYIHDYWEAGEGEHSIDLSGNNAGSLSQTFDTVAGAAYSVSYLIAGNPAGGGAIKTLTVDASGNAGRSESFDTTGKSLAAMGWEQRTYDFVANGASTTLTFATADSTGYGPALDGVSVTSAVPEPTTWAMMIGGFGMVGGTMRRRKRTLAFA